MVIANDSGMAHVAGFLRIPTLAICAPTDGDVVFGGYESVRVIQAKGSCTGCLWFKENGFKPWCAKGCDIMHDTKPEVVIEAVGEVLASVRSKSA